MRLSPEKSLHLAQLVARRVLAAAKAKEGVETRSSETQLRTRALDTIRAFLKRDEQMAAAARQKIKSLKRDVPEGSAEYEALYRQHYQQELDRLRKVK